MKREGKENFKVNGIADILLVNSNFVSHINRECSSVIMEMFQPAQVDLFEIFT